MKESLAIVRVENLNNKKVKKVECYVNSSPSEIVENKLILSQFQSLVKIENIYSDNKVSYNFELANHEEIMLNCLNGDMKGSKKTYPRYVIFEAFVSKYLCDLIKKLKAEDVNKFLKEIQYDKGMNKELDATAKLKKFVEAQGKKRKTNKKR